MAAKVQVFKAPVGPRPYGITTTPDGSIYYASLAGSHIARIDLKSHNSTVILPPTPDQRAKRISARFTWKTLGYIMECRKFGDV
jgi:virginiamycin B lyase